MRIAFATAAALPEIQPDDHALAVALEARGHTVAPLVWDRDDARGVDAVLVRSCWDQHLAPERFVAWAEGIEAAGVALHNPAATLAWGLDKRYLRELSKRGATIPRTTWVDRGTAPDLGALMDARGLDEVIVKPIVSLSAWETHRIPRARAEAAQAELSRLCAERDVMIQELVREVETAGELSFVFLDGAYSHAVRKRPKPGDFRVQEDFGGTREPSQPTAQQIAQAEAIVRHAPGPLLYARLDAVEVGDALVLMELELLDPVLFFRFAPAAAPDRLARALSEKRGGRLPGTLPA
jgi:glutathione synthase/RimK-type ligase-like ATP-grasp enzyme